MFAKLISYLSEKVYYVYDEVDELIATVTDSNINWTDGEEPFDGAKKEVLSAVKKESQ